MAASKPREPNPMHYYCSRRYNDGLNSAVYELMGMMRESSLKGRTINPPSALIKDAKSETMEKISGLDHSTPHFSEISNDLVLGKKAKKRLIMLIEGSFYSSRGEEELATLFPINLGTNPYQLFKRPKGSTIDAYIIQEKAREFLSHHRKKILKKGYQRFKAESSRFFYFRDNDLQPFKVNEEIDFKRLVPLIAEIPLIKNPGEKYPHEGYVGLENVNRPTREEFEENAVEFTSSRLKRASMVDKLVEKLLLPLGDDEFKPIDDWAAHRMVCLDEKKVRDLESRLSKSPKIRVVDKDDYYKNPKGNGFRNINLTAEVKGLKKYSELHVREIQIVHLGQYFKNEIDPEDPAHHSQQKKKQKSTIKRKRRLKEKFDRILREAFGIEDMVIYV